MRRTAIMLLQHGPLTLQEFVDIMGDKSYTTHQRLLNDLMADGLVKRIKKGVYALATS
jgi:predicted transcriptional regulator